MKRIIFAGLLLFVIGLAWFFFIHKKHGAGYTTETVKRGSLTSSVEATGTLEPVGTTSVDSTGTVTGGITVGAQVTGRIVSVNVDFNSKVKKGELLAQIDPLSYQAAVDQDQASLSVAQNTVINAQDLLSEETSNLDNLVHQKLKDQATLANDKINYGREAILVAKNYDSRQNLDNSKYAYQAQIALVAQDSAQIANENAKVLAAKLQIQTNSKLVDAATAKLMQDQANLSYTRIISPADGIVIANNTSVGQTVVASFSSPSLFVIAKSLSDMQIDTLVDEADVNKIQAGQMAKFNVDAFPTKTFTGAVFQIRESPIQQQNVVNYDVIVHVANPGNKLLPGMTANVTFIVAQKDDALKIPNRALLFTLPRTGKSKQAVTGFTTASVPKKTTPHVYVLQNGKPVRNNVKLGIANDSETEILEGLKEGDQVITGVQTQTQAKKNPYSTF